MVHVKFLYGACLFVMCIAAASFHNKPDDKYKTVTIGRHTWMAENLRQTTFQNGEVIAQAHTEQEWQYLNSRKTPAWCYHQFNSRYGKQYGLLYNYYAVKSANGLAPKGWHVASFDEWFRLNDALGPDDVGTKLKSTHGWKHNGNGTNTSGFTALPGGYRDAHEGEYSYWWTATEDTDHGSAGSYIFFLGHDMVYLDFRTYGWNDALYVRCVKDSL